MRADNGRDSYENRVIQRTVFLTRHYENKEIPRKNTENTISDFSKISVFF